jgi:tyrosyl-tRNA synthetase
MGKTEKGTLWVSREKTSSFDFFQHFINCLDNDVERLLRFFTKFDVEEIKKMCKDDIVNAKKVMAFEVTKLVHGEEEAIKARETSQNLFEKNTINTNNMPTETVEFAGNVNVLDLLASLSIIKSKSDARRLVEQGGIEIDGEKKTDTKELICVTSGKEMVVKKGKKTFVKVIIK